MGPQREAGLSIVIGHSYQLIESLGCSKASGTSTDHQNIDIPRVDEQLC